LGRGPLIFDVRRGSIEDGPGIRSVVFFKGCNLHCPWCHNPESIDPMQEIAFFPQGCGACGACEEACPFSACTPGNPQRIDRAACARCGACVDACPSNALRRVGRTYLREEILAILLRDVAFYKASGGGVTFSGGEPTLHMEYAADLLAQLKKRGIHTAIETNGLFLWEAFRRTILPRVDLIMMDVKLIDPEKHREYTGASNDLIIENLGRLARERTSTLLPRVPLIPGFTAIADNLGAIRSLLGRLGIERHALLAYHPTWFHKATAISRAIDPRLSTRVPTREERNGWSRLELCQKNDVG